MGRKVGKEQLKYPAVEGGSRKKRLSVPQQEDCL